MTTGNTTTGSLADSLEYVVSAARTVREIGGVMANKNAVDLVTLGTGKGLTYNEITVGQLTAQLVGEDDKLDNPQQISDTLFQITPYVVGIHTFISDRTKARISQKTFSQFGKLGQQAIQRIKEQDCAVFLDGASTSLGGAGNTITAGYIFAAAARIRGNATEGSGDDKLMAVLHPYHIKTLEDELIAGVGVQNIGPGLTAETYQTGFRGKIGGATVLENPHITIDSFDDAKGGVYARQSFVVCQGRSLWTKTRDEPDMGGGGGTSVWLYDEYAIGERSPGNWMYEIYGDATAPTS